MIDIGFNISSVADAARAARVMSAIEAAYPDDGVQTTTTQEPAAPATRGRGRQPRVSDSDSPKAPATDPVAAYTAAGGKMPDTATATTDTPTTDPAPTTDPTPTPAATTTTADPAPAATTAPATADPAPAPVDLPQSRDDLLNAFRTVCRELGHEFLKPHLDEFKVSKISEMTDEQLRKGLTAGAEVKAKKSAAANIDPMG
jgi:hypothetical protein